MALILQEKRATQAAASFLKLTPNSRLNYMTLLKYLYLADREALLRWGRPITFDEFFEMKLGPVLSKVDDLMSNMTRTQENSFWVKYISPPSNWCVSLLNDPGIDELSQAEMELIEETFALYRSYEDPFEFADFLHKILPELKGVSHGRLPISIGDILRAERRPPEQIELMEREIESVNRVHTLFSVS
jgi:hypothetical protein